MEAEIMQSKRLTVLARVPEREGVHGYHFPYFLLVQGQKIFEIFEDIFENLRFGT